MMIKGFKYFPLRMFRVLFFLNFILLLLQACLLPVNAEAETDAQQKNVLIIHSQDQFLPANIVMDNNIYSVLKSDHTLNVSIYSEYLEMVRFNSLATQNEIIRRLQVKYSNFKIDLVIITDDTSWEFMEKNGEALFPGVPVVLCGITEGKIDANSLKDNITGNLKNVDIKNTIGDILKVQPNTKGIAVVIGTSAQDAYYEKITRQAFNEYLGKVKANYIIGFSIEETQQKIANLPPNTVVLYVSMYTDGAGQGFNPRDVLTLLKKTSNAPIYGLTETYLGYGIVGGSLMSFKDFSQNAAEIALQVLNGKKPSEISIKVSENKKYFDWAEMQRWGINEKDLPFNSLIINKDLSLWDNYIWQIVGIILFILIETLMILLLLLQSRFNKKAKEEIVLLNNELEQKVKDRTVELEDVNSMLEKLNSELEEEVDERKKVEEQITQMNIGLERKVVERTNELAKMNEQLEENNSSLVEEIADRKRAEKEILYLSYHDHLTGLYNRRFYEEELARLDVERNYPLTLVLGDVNGLKLINDSFGHVMGDNLLKKVAEVLKKGCRADDIISRLGGDEFIIILPKTDAFEAEKIINRFNDLSIQEKVGSLSISISFGYETKKNYDEKIEDIFKKAEDHMYKKKLFESPSMRGKTIQAIINTLHEKNKREEAHSHRVSIFCEKIGQALNLLEGEIQELKTVGLLHDIGKIAIDETILNKPGQLTDDEWKEIRRHPEIGYRILSTLNDMSDMANYALYHHERWDGKGYPKGLKGGEIPFMSRIIAIADAYDAMTSERSYRSALPEEVIIAELQKNAGLQFDPKLVSVFIEKVLGKISGIAPLT